MSLGSAAGNKTPLAPSFASTLGASVTLPVASKELTLSGLWTYNSGFVTQVDNRQKQPAFSLFNASAEYRVNDRFSINGWVKNLTDTRFVAQLQQTGLGDLKQYAAPRTYGVDVLFNF